MAVFFGFDEDTLPFLKHILQGNGTSKEYT